MTTTTTGRKVELTAAQKEMLRVAREAEAATGKRSLRTREAWDRLALSILGR